MFSPAGEAGRAELRAERAPALWSAGFATAEPLSWSVRTPKRGVKAHRLRSTDAQLGVRP